MKTKVKKTKGKKIEKKRTEYVTFHPLGKHAEAALYYGFTPAKIIDIKKEDVTKTNAIKDSAYKGGSWLFHKEFAEERVAIIREYVEKNMVSLPQPVMIAHESESIKERAKHTVNLEIIGTNRPIAEAMLIKSAISILKDNGHENFVIEINSIGDKESINKFSKDLVNYYKKNLNALGAHCRQNFKKDPMYLLLCNECEDGKLKEAAPTSIASLSDESRAHFKEVLEYIETMGIPYKINNNLIPDRKVCSGTVFEIKEISENGEAGEVLAVGFRFDGLAQKVGHKRDIPGAGIKIFPHKKAVVKKVDKLVKPIAFYIQLGDEAKHRSLEVIELLKDSKIFIYHMLGRDKFGSQFSLVEKLKVPYVIIMGKKEFLENSVMVRENSTRTQQTILIEKLVEYLKNLPIV